MQNMNVQRRRILVLQSTDTMFWAGAKVLVQSRGDTRYKIISAKPMQDRIPENDKRKTEEVKND